MYGAPHEVILAPACDTYADFARMVTARRSPVSCSCTLRPALLSCLPAEDTFSEVMLHCERQALGGHVTPAAQCKCRARVVLKEEGSVCTCTTGVSAPWSAAPGQQL